MRAYSLLADVLAAGVLVIGGAFLIGFATLLRRSAMIIPFPRLFRRSLKEARKPHPFRDATRRRLRAIIEWALEILDSLDDHNRPPETAPARRFGPRRASTLGGA